METGTTLMQRGISWRGEETIDGAMFTLTYGVVKDAPQKANTIKTLRRHEAQSGYFATIILS